MEHKNETAEAIWIVIKRLFKWILLSLVGFLALVALIVGLTDYLNDRERRVRETLEGMVKVSARYDNSVCEKGYPYFYWVENASQKTVDSVEFTVEIRKRGYSSVLNDYTSITEDKILKPGEKVTGCFWAYKAGGFTDRVIETDADVVIKSKTVTFQ